MSAFSSTDLAALAALLREAGRAEIMPRFGRLEANQIRTKSHAADLVTDADEAAEAMIATGLAQRFPGALVVGEEGCAADPTLLPRLAHAEMAFVVDPIDGTANYAAGLPLFGVMAAAILHGQVIAACIHDPVTGETCCALRNAGAWRDTSAGRQAVRVAAPTRLGGMFGTLSWRHLPPAARERALNGTLDLAGAWDFRCAAHHYRLLASGQMHYSVYNRVLPWDHAPGWLLHREAGGCAAQFDGSPYSPLKTNGGLICTPDAAGGEALGAALGLRRPGGSAPCTQAGAEPQTSID